MQRHEFVHKIIRNSGSHFVSVEFVKADSTLRKATFNPKDTNDVKGCGTSVKNPNIVRFRDVKIKAWRSFDVERLKKIRALGTVFSFE